MRFRQDIPDLMISLTSFQDFDHDKEIDENFPIEWNLLPKDKIYWYCGQFYGIAEIVKSEVVDGMCLCTVKKVS